MLSDICSDARGDSSSESCLARLGAEQANLVVSAKRLKSDQHNAQSLCQSTYLLFDLSRSVGERCSSEVAHRPLWKQRSAICSWLLSHGPFRNLVWPKSARLVQRHGNELTADHLTVHDIDGSEGYQRISRHILTNS